MAAERIIIVALSNRFSTKPMATRSYRLSQFVTDRPPSPGHEVEVLCQDHVGTYVLPFLCRCSDGSWFDASIATAVEVDAVGWRIADDAGTPRRRFHAHRLPALKAQRA